MFFMVMEPQMFFGGLFGTLASLASDLEARFPVKSGLMMNKRGVGW